MTIWLILYRFKRSSSLSIYGTARNGAEARVKADACARTHRTECWYVEASRVMVPHLRPDD